MCGTARPQTIDGDCGGRVDSRHLLRHVQRRISSPTAIAAGAQPLDTWQSTLFHSILGFSFDPNSLVGNVLHGMLYYLPVLLVTFAIGGNVEALFAVLRKHEINEGFLVTLCCFL